MISESASLVKMCICADDFGSHPGVDKAIFDLIDVGIVGAASVLVTSDHIDEGLLKESAKKPISLGLHVAFSDTSPLSDELRDTVWVKDGKFISHWKKLIPQLLTKPIPKDKIVNEWSMQAEKMLSLVGRIDYIDSHQNLHLLPGFSEALKEVMSKFNISRARVYHDSFRVTNPLFSLAKVHSQFRFRNTGQLHCFGIYDSGKQTLSSAKRCIIDAKDRFDSFWLVMHPGSDDNLNPRLNYSLCWEQEYELLASKEFRDWLEENEVQLVNC